MKKYLIIAMCTTFFTVSALAAEVEGITVPEQVVVVGKTLHLNGAGVRTKFFFDIYVGALYLPNKATTVEQVLKSAGPKRLTMTFLYDEVSREKLVDGWVEGFEKNQPKAKQTTLKDRLNQFNGMFIDAHKGDLFAFDFLKNGDTVVTLKGKKAGFITGADFQYALLEVWLGNKPADKALKAAMIRGTD